MDFSIVTCLWERSTELISACGRSLIAESKVKSIIAKKCPQLICNKEYLKRIRIREVIAIVLVMLFSPVQPSAYSHGDENHAEPVEGFITEEVWSTRYQSIGSIPSAD